MATVMLRDLSEELYSRVKRAAELERRSVPAEIASLIERALPAVELSAKRLDILNSLDMEWISEPELPGDSAELLREDRDR